MKILTLVGLYVPHWAGLTANAQAIAEGLARRGHEVTVLTVRHDPSLPAEEEHGGVRVVRTRPITRLSRGHLAPGLTARAAGLIPQHDVAHMHTPMVEALVLAGLCRARGTPLVMTHQGDLVLPAGAANRVIQSAGNASLAAAARLATRVTTFTRDYAEHSPVLTPALSKLEAIYPPISLPAADPKEVESVRAAAGGDARRVVGFAGRFVEEKGFDYLLRAIPAVLQAEPDTMFAFAGEHDIGYERFYERCRPLLEAFADRIRLLGLILDRRRLAAFYTACDVLALPSRTDCFASVQVEALLCGTPVVATDIPGGREPVRVTGMGTLVAPRDPEALAAGLIDVLRRRDHYTASAAQAREIFDAEQALDRYEALLELAAAS